MYITSATFEVGIFAPDVPLIVYVAERTSSLSRSSLAYMVLNNGPHVCAPFTVKPIKSLELAITCLKGQFCSHIIRVLKRCC